MYEFGISEKRFWHLKTNLDLAFVTVAVLVLSELQSKQTCHWSLYGSLVIFKCCKPTFVLPKEHKLLCKKEHSSAALVKRIITAFLMSQISIDKTDGEMKHLTMKNEI